MGLIGEAIILLGGLGFILYSFIKNSYYHGIPIAKLRALMHFDGVRILLVAFVDVFMKGKNYKEIMNEDH